MWKTFARNSLITEKTCDLSNKVLFVHSELS